MITYTLKKENLQKNDLVKENFQKIKYDLQKNCKFTGCYKTNIDYAIIVLQLSR